CGEQKIATFLKGPNANIYYKNFVSELPFFCRCKHRKLDTIGVAENFAMGLRVQQEALFDVLRRDDDPVRDFIARQLSLDGQPAGPLGPGRGGEYLVLRQNVPAAPVKPNRRPEAPLGKPGGLQVDAGHADQHVAGLQAKNDRSIEY